MRELPLNAIRQSGMTLIELMVAVTIGAILMTGLVAVFNNSGEARRELEKSGQLIENGRYAVNLLYEDLRHAGFYGHYYKLGDPPGALPDPCEITNTTDLKNALAMPIQGYRATLLANRPDVTGTTCDDKGLLTTANTKAGSDILVIRRADTALLAGTMTDPDDGTLIVATGTPINKEVYVQANNRDAFIQIGNPSAGVIDPTNTGAKAADNTAQSLKKYPNKSVDTWADIRKYRVHVYFVAPCSFGTGANGVCQTGDDEVPTLKRLELNSSGTATQMEIVPLVEGVEYMKVEYGVDSSPTTVNGSTGLAGDGVPDGYEPEPDLAEWPLVVSARVHILARNLAITAGHKDEKSYVLADVTPGPFDDAFKRHVFNTEARPMNLAGRREIPK